MPPGVAAEVVQERKDRSATALGDRLVSKGNLPTTKEEEHSEPLKIVRYPLELNDKKSSSSLPATNVTPSDSTPLLGDPVNRINSWGSNLNTTVFKVTSYLGLAGDRALLLQAYDDSDDKLNLFKQTYEQEVSMCISYVVHIDI